jgi:hypothetical protein
MPDGLACRAPALRGKTVCYWHDPDKAEEAAESRRIGGLHRRKAKSVATIYDFSGLRTVESAQRLLETAAIETLALENSIARNRTLISAAAGAGKLIEAGDQRREVDPEFSRDRERLFARERFLDGGYSGYHNYLLRPVLRADHP